MISHASVPIDIPTLYERALHEMTEKGGRFVCSPFVVRRKVDVRKFRDGLVCVCVFSFSIFLKIKRKEEVLVRFSVWGFFFSFFFLSSFLNCWCGC